MPMRDGVRLATDIYRPALNGEPVPGRFPAILGRTSYDKTQPLDVGRAGRQLLHAARLRRRRSGPARAVTNRRGPGSTSTSPTRTMGGTGTTRSSGSRPSRGRTASVGMVGSSHGAMTQTTAALAESAASRRDLAGRRPHQATTLTTFARVGRCSSTCSAPSFSTPSRRRSCRRPGRQEGVRAGDGAPARLGLADALQARPDPADPGAGIWSRPSSTTTRAAPTTTGGERTSTTSSGTSTATPTAPAPSAAVGTTPTPSRRPATTRRWRRRTRRRNAW